MSGAGGGRSDQNDPTLGEVARAGASRWRRRIGDHLTAGDLRGLAALTTGALRHRIRRAAPLESLLFRYGRYLHPAGDSGGGPFRVVPFRLPHGVSRVGATGFVIDLSKVTTYCGFSFAPSGWHPFLEIIREFEADPSLRYEDSALWRLYDRFQPATLQEALFDNEPVLPPLDRLPAQRRLLRSLWALDPGEVRRLVGQAPHRPTLDEASRYYGPKTTPAGEWHFRKVIDLYASIRRHGYDPVRFGGERPKGYFLVRDGDYRFVIGHANRRLAGVRAAGVPSIVASFFEHVPPVVDEAELARWSAERGGAFPLDVVTRVFDRLFTATGAERADALGLR